MDTLDRDRRWCQGNIQHAALLAAPGLHWINRFHLLRGVLNYTIAPIWCAMVTTGALMAATRSTMAESDALILSLVFLTTLIFLVLPKALACVHAMKSESLRHGFGGAVSAGMSLAAETVMSTLLTPVVMVSHTFMVVSVLIGYKSGWKSQRRSEYEVSRAELVRRFAAHAVIGAVLLIVMANLSPSSLLMTAGAAISLMLAGPLARYTAQKTPDDLQALFRIPEEHVRDAGPLPEAEPARDTGRVGKDQLNQVFVT
jgi:membrane glycosyltransferase